MAQVFMGKLLPNLNISVDNETDDVIEEGELSDDEDITEDPISKVEPEPPKKNVDVVRGWMQTLNAPKIYENKNGGFVTGIDLSSEVMMKKLEDRAERFGLQKKEETAPITQNEIDALYKSLEIDPANLNSCKLKNIRLDALHMRGVDEMSTNEIFKYFGKYGPASVEWINDSSCNVVWLDEATTARALLGCSQPLKIKKKNESILLSSEPSSENVDKKSETGSISDMSDSEEDDDNRKARTVKSNPEAAMDIDTPTPETVVDAKSIDIPVPPGHWRVGEPHPKAKALLLRFATKDDKKIRGAEKRSQYYRKYGNPNYGGLTGLISQSRKRKIQSAKNRLAVDQLIDESADPTSDFNITGEVLNRPIAKVTRTKVPKMKMYADEEEEKAKSGVLRKIQYKPKPGSIHSRLGTKYTRDDLIHLGSKFSSDSEEEETDDIEINCTVPSKFNIWTDLAKSMAKEDHSRLRNDDSSDLESELDSYRNLRAQDSRTCDSQNLRTRDSQNLRTKDLDLELDSYRSERNLKRSVDRESRQPRNSERSGDSRTRSSGLSRSRLGKGDLRSTLSSISRRRDNSERGSYSRRRDEEKSFSGRRDSSREDLRSKLKRLKREDSEEPRKYRSPLCVDD